MESSGVGEANPLKLMDPRLDNYNWSEVFGEGSGGNCTPIVPQPAPPSFAGHLDTFGRNHVAEIIQMQDGVHDELDWIIYGKLHDGRYFAVRAGCDYTGWDCRAGNSGDVAGTLEAIVRFGLSDEERKRFGLSLTTNN